MDMTRNQKLVAVLCIFLLLLTILLYAVPGIDRADKIAFTIDSLPGDANITINGNETKKGVIYLEPGTYDVKASRKGFKNYTNRIVVSESTPKTYAVFLEAETDEAKKWLRDNEKEYYKIRVLNEQAIKDSGEIFHKKNPIAVKLPDRSAIYTIGYQIDKSDPTENSIIVTIDASEGHKQAALYRIRQLGFDPTDLNIIFRDYENPFAL